MNDLYVVHLTTWRIQRYYKLQQVNLFGGPYSMYLFSEILDANFGLHSVSKHNIKFLLNLCNNWMIFLLKTHIDWNTCKICSTKKSLHTSTWWELLYCKHSIQNIHTICYNIIHDVWICHKVPHYRISCSGNWSKQIQETHTAYSAGKQYTWQSLNEKQQGHPTKSSGYSKT